MCAWVRPPFCRHAATPRAPGTAAPHTRSCAAGRLTRARAPGTLGAALAAAAAPPPLPANRLTGLRLACNLFRHAPLRAWAAAQRGALLRAFGGGAGAGAGETRAARGAWASLLVDLALLYRSEVRCSTPWGEAARATRIGGLGEALSAHVVGLL
jgi:hypothetical protein